MNGPPGIGKSTLAQRYVDGHPLALLVDIDRLRTALGQWESHPDEAKPLARRLGLALASIHLAAGHDVVVPQLLGNRDFIVALEEAAEANGAEFCEVLLRAPSAVLLERFRARRRELAARGEAHPQDEIADSEVDEVFRSLDRAFEVIVGVRPRTVVVDIDDLDVDGAATALEAAIASVPPCP